MNENTIGFIYCVTAIVLGIISIKVIFSIWDILVVKKYFPEKFTLPKNSPETTFKNLEKKSVTVKLKSGEILSDIKYNKTIFFNDGEFAVHTTVYFEFIDNKTSELMFVSGIDILSIKENINSPQK